MLTKSTILKLGDILEEFDQRLGVRQEPEILTLTERMGFVSQRQRFNKRLAISDTRDYKLIGLNDIAFNPYLLWAGAVAQNTGWEEAIVSPLYPTFHVRKGYSPRFANYLLCSGFLRSHYSAISFGSVPRKRRATVKDFLDLRIPQQPSLAEQERLVKLLDEADELRKLRTQANRRTADLIPALFHDIFGDAGHIAHNIRPLSEVAEVVSGVAKGRRFNGQKPVTVPYIRVANVQAGYLDLAEIKTIEALPSEVKELTLKNGDVLLTEGGDFDKLGRGALWEREIPNCIHQNHVFRVRVDYSKLLPVYFEKFLQTPVAKRYFLGCAKRTTTLASINMTQLRGLPVPVPSLTLQRDFAARVSEIRAMEFQQAASRRRLDDLFHSLLHRAFQGEV